MSWDYRVVRREYGDEVILGIYEAYYDDNGTCWAITEIPMVPYGETWDELAGDLGAMVRALGRRVLDYETREELK